MERIQYAFGMDWLSFEVSVLHIILLGEDLRDRLWLSACLLVPGKCRVGLDAHWIVGSVEVHSVRTRRTHLY